MADQPSLPLLQQTPNQPGSVADIRDGITVESNTGTQAELKAGIDALDQAIDTHDETVETPSPSRDPAGRFKGRRHSAVARMADATAKEAAAKRERDTVTAENARLKAELATRSAPPQPPPSPPPQARVPQPPPADPEPDARDASQYPAGEYDPRYLRDIGRYEARQEYQRQRATEQQAQAAEQHFRTVEHGMRTYAEKMQAAFPEKDGLDTFLKELSPTILNLRPTAVQTLVAPGSPLTGANVIADVISDADHPVALMRYLSDHPKDFQRLSTLHPIQVFREMGKLEATLAAASPSRPAPRDSVSRARPPVQRVESVPQMSDGPPGDDASDEDHAAYYNRKERQRRFGKG